MGCGQRFPRDVNNLGEVRTALARSGTMPLQLEVTLAGQATSFFFASLLRPNADRITSLHISTDICLEGTELLFNFDFYDQRPIAFVNLKRLVVRITAKPEVDEDDDLPIRLFDASTAQMPVLHHLELQGPYQLSHEANLHALKYVRLPIHELDDFGYGLELCENIRNLQYDISDANLRGTADLQLKEVIRSRLLRLAPDVLVVSDIYESIASTILDLVHIAELPSLTLVFRSRSTLNPEWLNILSDIESCQSVSWSRSEEHCDKVELSAAGPSGKMRKIVWKQQLTDSFEHEDRLWNKFPLFQALEYLDIDYITWEELHNTMPDTPELRTLNLVLFGRNELRSVLPKVFERITRTKQLDRLCLQLTAQDLDDDDRRHFAQSFIDALHEFGMPKAFRQLQSLKVTGLNLLESFRSM